MPRKEPNSENDGLPDLEELILSITEKLKNSFKARNHNNTKINDETLAALPAPSCSCAKENTEYIIELIVKCNTCKKVVKQKTITNPYKVAALLTIISYGVTQFIDYAVTDNRYPLDIEYTVMDSCTNSYERPLVRSAYGKKKSVCLCALEDAMNEISYTRYLVDKKGFLDVFEEKAVDCIEQQR
jgi:hypothetical protein